MNQLLNRRLSSVNKFSFNYYRQLLVAGLNKGYRISSFERYDSSTPMTMILRHDVDYTLNGVLDLARIEFELGCTATYLFRVHADEYNLFSCSAVRIINELISMGHEIGLHFEAMNVGRALGLDPQDLLVHEKNVIQAILGSEVRTCSEHRELSGIIHQTPRYDQIYDPYAAGFDFYSMDIKYCKEMKYLSDSNGNWREGDPLEHYGKHPRMQVLIHPDWWFEKDLLLKGPYVHPRGIEDY